MKFSSTSAYRFSARTLLAAAFIPLLLCLESGSGTASAAGNYKLPGGNEGLINDENTLLLQKISKGVGNVSKKANQAIVI